MPLSAVSVIVGLLLPLALPVLPAGPALLWRLLAVGLFACSWPRKLQPVMRHLGMVAAGSAWTLAAAISHEATKLPVALDRCSWQLEGTVVDLPVRAGNKIQFYFVPTSAKHLGCPVATAQPPAWTPVGTGKLRLSLYNANEMFTPGNRLRLDARLRVTRGAANPIGFDYEAWVAREHVIATGYVQKTHRVIPESQGIDAARHKFGAWLAGLAPLRHVGQMRALLVADQRGLSVADWQTLRRTGTVHLLVVSGLHISLAAGFGWLLGFLSALLTGGHRYRQAAIAACAIALAYSLAAGFGIAAQRALIMVCIFAGLTALHRHIPLSHRYIYSLLTVLVITPLAPLGAGFWLSFVAVLALLLTLTNTQHHRPMSWLLRLLLAQLALFLVLSPLLMQLQGASSLIAPVANIVAVPWLSFFVLPALFIGVIFDGLATVVGVDPPFALHIADWFLLPLNAWLGWLAQFEALHYPAPQWLPMAVIAGFLLLLPLSWRARGAAAFIWVLAVTATDNGMGESDTRFVLLDVGQGLSAFVQRGATAVIYDTGPLYPPRFDAGRDVLNPVLKHFGVREVSHIIVSHEDLDHAGGLASVRRAWPQAKLIAGQPEKIADGKRVARCTNRAWQAAGIQLRTFVPLPQAISDNDRSCILMFTIDGFTILLPGDISKRGERALLPLLKGEKIAVLAASHHGSAHSSDAGFLQAIQPEQVLYSAGWGNRFKHPTTAACARAKATGARLFSTARQGAIELVINNGQLAATKLWRCQSKRWWRQLDAIDCSVKTGLVRACP